MDTYAHDRFSKVGLKISSFAIIYRKFERSTRSVDSGTEISQYELQNRRSTERWFCLDVINPANGD